MKRIQHIPVSLTRNDGVVVVAVPGVGTLETLVFVELTPTLLVAIIEGHSGGKNGEQIEEIRSLTRLIRCLKNLQSHLCLQNTLWVPYYHKRLGHHTRHHCVRRRLGQTRWWGCLWRILRKLGRKAEDGQICQAPSTKRHRSGAFCLLKMLRIIWDKLFTCRLAGWQAGWRVDVGQPGSQHQTRPTGPWIPQPKAATRSTKASQE